MFDLFKKEIKYFKFDEYSEDEYNFIIKLFILNTHLTKREAQNALDKYIENNYNIYLTSYNNKLSGFVVFNIENNNTNKLINIIDLHILEKYQSKGIGNIILNNIKQLQYNLNLEKITLEVENKNHRALKFYKNNGFEVVKTSLNFSYLEYNNPKSI